LVCSNGEPKGFQVFAVQKLVLKKSEWQSQWSELLSEEAFLFFRPLVCGNFGLHLRARTRTPFLASAYFFTEIFKFSKKKF
jgi:hypothetical protein